MGAGSQIWGWDTANWQKVLTNAAGNLEIVPAAAAVFPSHCYGYDGANWHELLVQSAATPNLRVSLYYGVNIASLIAFDAVAIPTGGRYALVTSSVVALYDGAATNRPLTNARLTLDADSGRYSPPACLYGWNGGSWDRLRTESNIAFNLRTRLYGGANAVLVGQSSAALAYTNYGLETFAILYGDDGTNLSRVGMLLDGADAVDNALNTLGVASMLYGFNGGSWDRLRVDAAYNLQVDVNEVRKTDTSTITSISVGVASTNVLAANAARIFAEFVNDSANVIYLALGTPAVLNRGIRLNANGGSFEIGLTNLYTGAVTAISGVAASNLTVSEG